MVYRPNAGFTGADHFRYLLEAPEGMVLRDISVIVEAHGGRIATQPFRDGVPVQPPGAVPVCDEPVS